MEIYLDSDYKCHTFMDDGYKAYDLEYFDGKCHEYIEGYRFVPSGETWVREDGVAFRGEMVAPWKPLDELDAAQREYERQQLMDANAQNAELLGTMAAMVDEVYQSDIETLGI